MANKSRDWFQALESLDLGIGSNPELVGAQRLTSMAPSAWPLVVAWMKLHHPNRPVVALADKVASYDRSCREVRSWLSILAEGQTQQPAVLEFSAWDALPSDGKLPHVDVITDRVNTLCRLTEARLPTNKEADVSSPLIMTSVDALVQKTFLPTHLAERLKRVCVGDQVDPLDLVEWLEDQGYEPEAQVTARGELSLRGGILDVFPPDAPIPIRLDFFGDEVESIKAFDSVSQRSLEGVEEVLLSPAGELGLLRRAQLHSVSDKEPAKMAEMGTLCDYLPDDTIWLILDPDGVEAAAERFEAVPDDDAPFIQPWSLIRQDFREGQWLELVDPDSEVDVLDGPGDALPSVSIESLEAFRSLTGKAPEPQIAEVQRKEFFGQIHRWCRQRYRVALVLGSDGEEERFREIWREFEFDDSPDEKSKQSLSPLVWRGAIHRGFIWPEEKLVVVSDAELFGRYKSSLSIRKRGGARRKKGHAFEINFTEFEAGDFVVHIQHGVGRFRGLTRMKATSRSLRLAAENSEGEECLIIEFAASDYDQEPPKLYVPVSEAHLVSKYVGAGKIRPPLNRLGGAKWSKTKAQAEKAILDLASEMLRIQAIRESQEGYVFGPDTAWQKEFEDAFEFDETDDQVKAIEASKQDMESGKPMDRLICGDVGFGKTEVAIRAAFKAVMDGRQVAVLAPTTVLAQQHYTTLRDRMAGYPVSVEILSRFKSKRQQTETVERLKQGAVDIVVGTHRLVQADVIFKDLGLVVIDEEQRFGVAQKEKFKRLRHLVDVITLSATPIPRTLYLALTGARDMSTLETPPLDRLPIETIVTGYDERVIREAIKKEIQRGGQVFFLHNRVTTIDVVHAKLAELVPEARIVVGHGQMKSRELEKVMSKFIDGDADILLSTTIIESGVDIPNANTIIIDRADRFGLSELYQLRGRVGRWKRQAYAYLLLPRHAGLLADARKRLSAIKQYATLGSGFKIALRDLEIRGAGNLLGAEQSGHITAVGFELYCQLLKQTVGRLKGEEPARRVEVKLRIDFLHLYSADESIGESAIDTAQAGIPQRYMANTRNRIEIYRKLAECSTVEDLKDVQTEVRDRFGPLPETCDRLFKAMELKVLSSQKDIELLEVREGKLMILRNGDYLKIGGRFPRLSAKSINARLKEMRRLLMSI